MQFLLDNLVATVVAGFVVFLLASVSINQAEGTRDSTRFYAHQKAQSAFVDQLEYDLVEAGTMHPDSAAAGTPPIVYAEPGVDSVAFYGVVDTTGNAKTPGVIAYSWALADTLDGSPVWSVQRWSDGVRSGGTAPVLGRFSLVTLTDGAVPVAAGTYDQARAFRVSTEWVLPMRDGDGAERRQALRRSTWSTVIRPIGFQP